MYGLLLPQDIKGLIFFTVFPLILWEYFKAGSSYVYISLLMQRFLTMTPLLK